MILKADGTKFSNSEIRRASGVPLSREIGQPHIVTSSNYIQELSKTELQYPRLLRTIDNMAMDDAVHNCLHFTDVLLTLGLSPGKFVNEVSTKGKRAAEFLNYNIHNMMNGYTWLKAVKNINTALKYGFSSLNIVVEKKKYGKYRGSYTLKKLAPRDQKSLAGWVWTEDFREVVGFVQKPNLKSNKNLSNQWFGNIGLNQLQDGRYYDSVYPYIKMDQLLHVTYNETNNNVQGRSPLLACYSPWLEKTLVKKYEVAGVSKDMGGMVVLRVPSQLIERGNKPSEFPDENRELIQIQRDAAALHAGENAFIMLTSDTDELSKKYLYDVTLQGIEGSGGKQYNTSDIIEQRNKAIYNSLGAAFLILGQSNVGAYNLSTTGQSVHGFVTEDALLQFSDALTHQLGKTLLRINNFKLKEEEIPKFVFKDPGQYDRDILGKLVQRLGSVGYLTPEALKLLYTEAGWDTKGIEDLDFDSKGDSRAGEGLGTSGTGNTQQGGGAVSTNNLENADTSKSFIQDKKGRIIDTDLDKPIKTTYI